MSAIETAADFPEERAILAETWKTKSGLLGWIAATDHKELGLRYIFTALFFFACGGVEAALMRIQLTRPENTFLNPDQYNQIFTMHGSTMMFLFAVPIMQGFALYLYPLMIGTRDVPFPKLNNYGYWTYLFGGLFLYGMFLLKAGPDAGWFSYTPLSGPTFDPGKRADTWAQMITFTEISALIIAVEIIVGVFKMRAPGMSLNRIPLYVWGVLVVSFMVVFAMPAVMLDSTFLIFDRSLSMHFFNQSEGGDAIFYQHLFWFFGHPEVYIIFIPALGFISAILTTFSRRKIFGYTLMVTALVFTAFMAFGLWVHHMFATGLPQLGQSFFTAASMMISIPTGVQIFCWIATLWAGSLRIRTPVLYVLGFFFVFIIGGMTGVMLASVPLDWQVHDTYFVVAHFHYVLIGGALFPLFGALFYWFPKFSGRMYNELWGRISFVLVFIGFNLTFYPMHHLGFRGMPRRIYTYQPEMGWQWLNVLASIGAAILAIGIVIMLINLLVSRSRGAEAGPNPWDADTLEWAVPSPPPHYNFVHIPIVSGQNALWDAAPDQPHVTGLSLTVREVLVTKVLDAEPDHREELPEDSLWPFVLAIVSTAGLIGSIFFAWWFTIGVILSGLALIGWFWPKREEVDRHLRRERGDVVA